MVKRGASMASARRAGGWGAVPPHRGTPARVHKCVECCWAVGWRMGLRCQARALARTWAAGRGRLILKFSTGCVMQAPTPQGGSSRC